MPRPDQIWNGDEIGFDPGNWTGHNTESGYMDRHGFFKAVTAFVRLAGASADNPQYIFLDGHDSHWDSDALDLLRANHCHVFFLKAGDSENDQPLDNGPNELIKASPADFPSC